MAEMVGLGRTTIGRQLVMVLSCGHAETMLAWTFNLASYTDWRRVVLEGCGECRGLTIPEQHWIREWEN